MCDYFDQDFIVFSSLNIERALHKMELAGLTPEIVGGMWRGYETTAFVLPASHERLIRDLGILAGQQAMIFVRVLPESGRKLAFIDFLNKDHTEVAGDWITTTEHEAKTQDSYTYKGDNYYIIKELEHARLSSKL